MNLTLAGVAQQEEELQLSHFNHDVAWQLGCALKQIAERQQVSVAMEVYGFGQTLFQYAMPGTCADHLDWMRRKRNAVLRYGHSSYYLFLYNIEKQRDFEAQRHLDAAEYCAHGGSFPIRIAGSGLVGAVTVSGLPQLEDHQTVCAALQSVLQAQSD